MPRLLPLALLAASLSVSAKGIGEVDGPGSYDLELERGGRDRTFRLHVPKGFEKGTTAPLVLVFHGLGSDGKQTEQLTGFSPIADREGFLVAYPDGDNRMWRYWGSEEQRPKLLDRFATDDVGFVRALIDALVKAGLADDRRVYATGISNGAYLSTRLACDLADRIAAIAPVSGAMLKPAADVWKPSRAVPVLYVHGTEDPIVGYDGKDRISGRAMSLSAEDLVKWWAAKDGCPEKPEVEKLPDADADDGTTVERWTFGPGEDDAEVVFYRITGGGHTWPHGPAIQRVLGNVCGDWNASEAIWEFFAMHPMPR